MVLAFSFVVSHKTAVRALCCLAKGGAGRGFCHNKSQVGRRHATSDLALAGRSGPGQRAETRVGPGED